MAEYLASIFGTEKDKVNCSFYFKIGACRHGDKCSRIHNRPTFSQTILLQNLYQNPKLDIHRAEAMLNVGVSDAEEQQHFDEFFEEIFTELEDKYGEIEEMNVCDNIGEHMIGNVYVKFKREEDAEKAAQAVNNRWFNGMPVYAELSPVTDFREACCRQYEMGECTRGGFCNFMHLKPISYELRRELYNRDHPWRSLNDDTDDDADGGAVAKKKKRRSSLKKRRKRKKLSPNLMKKRFINGLNEFYANLNATSSSITNQTNNSLIHSTSNDVDSSLVKTKKRRKIFRRRKKVEVDGDSTFLPVAYQRAHCISSSSSESSSDTSSSPSHCRLPSPFRDLFPSKQRRIAANGSSSTTTVASPAGDDLINKIAATDDVVDDSEKTLIKVESDCGKGGFCNFMHLKPISRELRRKLYGRKRHSSPSRASGRYGQGGPNDVTSSRRRSRTRSRSPDRRGGDRDRGRRNRY